MDYVLDDERLTGARAAQVTLRPWRSARVVPPDDIDHLMAAIELNCQLWGGAASPLVPLTGQRKIDELYRDWLRGADVDNVLELTLIEAELAAPTANPLWPTPSYRDELACMFLEEAKKDWYRPVTVPVLDPDDPWRQVYAACLGILPEVPCSELLNTAQLNPALKFEDFISIDRVRVAGSLSDLLSRVGDLTSLSPRNISMAQLAYGIAPDLGIRGSGPSGVLPRMRFEASDAGPNIVVVCTPGNISDITLLWNLRAAHGDYYSVPLGILVDEYSSEAVTSILRSPICRDGIAYKSLYITSTSVDVETLQEHAPDTDKWEPGMPAVASPKALVSFGPAPGRPRTEVSVWSDGRSTMVPVSAEDQASLPLRGRSWSNLALKMDISVTDSPFPHADDVRVKAINEEFFAGTLTMGAGGGHEDIEVNWPTRMLMLRAVCAARNLEVEASKAGNACMPLLESLDGVQDLHFLAHAPLLELLEQMAQRQGVSWAKAHLRASGDAQCSDLEQVSPSEDDLAEVDFNKFREALGSVDAARAWLDWAEPRRIIVKGFPIDCEKCRAKQWVPVTGFSPPIICRGCSRAIDRPFRKDILNFKYRLGESIRRVFEEDAIGHLLVMRYFTILFSGGRSNSLIGAHPGLDVVRAGASTRLGEADVLLLRRDGHCIPIEVKRSFKGATAPEAAKLDALATAFDAPWSVLAVPDWARAATSDFTSYQVRDEAAQSHRLLLTYEQLLDPHPIWSMGSDPFLWAPMTNEQIEERESEFVRSVVSFSESGATNWFERAFLYRAAES